MLLKIILFGVLIILILLTLIPILLYLKIRKYFEKLPIVAAEITHSKLLDYNDVNGKRIWEAEIKFRYRFRGEDYKASTPALRSPQLFDPHWDFESQLVEDNPVGEFVNVRVIPQYPDMAYIAVAPFSFGSALLLPVITVLYALFLFGYFYYIGGGVIDMFTDPRRS